MALRLFPHIQRAACVVTLIAGTSLAGTAVLSATASAAPVQMGAWTRLSFQASLDAPCGVANVSLDREAQFNAFVERHGEVSFIVSVDEALWQGDRSYPEFLVDGMPVEMAVARQFGRDAIQFISRYSDRDPGSLLSTLERGERAVVQANGRRFTFDLTGTSQAMAQIERCHKADKLPSASAGSAPTGSGNTEQSGSARGDADRSASLTSGGKPVFERTIGEWHVASMENPFGARCVMGQIAPMSVAPGSATSPPTNPRMMLGAFETMGVTRFTITFGATDLGFSAASPPPITLVVDDRTVEIDAPEVVNGRTLVLRDRAGASPSANDPSGSWAMLRNGQRAKLTVAGYRASFDLKGSAAALGALTECSGDDGHVARAEVEAEIALEVEGDREDAGLSPGGEVEREEEETPPGSPGLGGILERYASGNAAPVARYRCIFTGLNLIGMPDRPGSTPEATTLIVREDGSLLLNGTTVAPEDARRTNGRLTHAAYSMALVFKAMLGAVPERSPLANQSARQDAAYQAAHRYFRDQLDQVFAKRQRFLMVGVESDTVGAFDLGRDGNPVAQTTPDCLRLP